MNTVMRNLGAAWRALRLYPASSPMPLQASGAVCGALGEYLSAEPSLKLDVVRGGFILRGVDELLTAPGVPELVDALASHGVGELHFVAPPSDEEVLALLSGALLQPDELLAKGGMQPYLAAEGVGAIKIVAVVLSKVETPPEIPEDEADKFLADLAADPGRLAMWLRSLLAFDNEGLIEGILTLFNASEGLEPFGRTMAAAFLELDTEAKDRLIEVAIDLEPLREVLVEMIGNLSTTELTAAIRGGRFGENLMGLSYALSELPVGDRFDDLVRETTQALEAADVDGATTGYLTQLVETRRSGAVQAPLIEVQPAYRAMADSIILQPGHLEYVRNDIESRAHLDAKGVRSLMQLLDLADDFTAYSRILDALSRSVPHLLESGDLDLAMHIVSEVIRRATDAAKPWPELQNYVGRATEAMCGARSMTALLQIATTNASAVEHAKELVSLSGDSAARSLASAALSADSDEAMSFANAVLGRRLPELLAADASRAEERHVARLAAVLAQDGGPWCMQALGHLASRPEDRVRAELARGIGAAGGDAARSFMPRLLRDTSVSVAKISALVLARRGDDESIRMLGERLSELEGDRDLALAREMIGLLASSPSPSADAALREIAERGSFLRRGRFTEMKRMAREALDARHKEGQA